MSITPLYPTFMLAEKHLPQNSEKKEVGAVIETFMFCAQTLGASPSTPPAPAER